MMEKLDRRSELTKKIEEINIEVFKHLLRNYHSSLNDEPPKKFKIIFPKYRNKKIRVSEQEARFLYALYVNENTDFTFSVETPTDKEAGIGKRSGCTDLSLYNMEGRYPIKIVDIEFKQGQSKDIEKDIRKFMDLKKLYVWFHILEKDDTKDKTPRKTLNALFDKFLNSFPDSSIRSEGYILFCICSFPQKCIYQKVVKISEAKQVFKSVDEFMNEDVWNKVPVLE